MKVLICDYKEELNRDIEYEKEVLINNLKDNEVQIEVYPFENKEKLKEKIRDADVLLTAFIEIDEEVLRAAKKLRLISVNAAGYGAIDIDYAAAKNIAVCNVAEYCTQEVSEHVLSLILALSRNLKGYVKDVEERKRWSYLTKNSVRRLEGQTLGIFGLGKIGQAVAKRAQGFGIKVIAVDPFLPKEIAGNLGVELVDKEYALKNSDIISNHMNVTAENKQYFTMEEFKLMEKHPIFINAGRGVAVNEADLLAALNKKIIRGAGLDVLESENPNLNKCEFLNRRNVIVTPHAAFYSENSMRELQKISCENIIHFFNGEKDKVFRIVN